MLYAPFLATLASAVLSVVPSGFGLFSPAWADPSYTTGGAFTPDGTTVYFAKSQPGYTGLTIFLSYRRNAMWTAPEVAPFSGVYRDTDPVITPDGNRVIFASARPPFGDGASTYKLWEAYLSGPKAGTVEMLPAVINGEGSEGHPSLARDGTLYFSKSVGSVRRLYRAPVSSDSYGTPQEIDLPGDGAQVADIDPAIAPDGRFLVFSSNRPDSYGANDLYVSFRKNGLWCAPLHLETPVNSIATEFGPDVAPDGHTLYFASSRTSLIQPRAAPATAQSFRTELADYARGTVRTYKVDLAKWLSIHSEDACNQ